MTTEHSSSVLLTEEEKNSSFDFTKPVWDIVRQVEGRVHHRLFTVGGRINTYSINYFRLVLSEEVPGLTGTTFSLEGVPKPGFVFTKTGNKLETGVDFRYFFLWGTTKIFFICFRQELSGMFTWTNNLETSRLRTKIESVKFPNSITPKTHIKVSPKFTKPNTNSYFIPGFYCNSHWNY